MQAYCLLRYNLNHHHSQYGDNYGSSLRVHGIPMKKVKNLQVQQTLQPDVLKKENPSNKDWNDSWIQNLYETVNS